MSNTSAHGIESSVEDAGTSRKRVSITVPAETVGRRIQETYGQVAREARIPGFRKGRIPKQVIEKRFGAHLQQEILEHLVSTSVNAALDEHELSPLGEIDLKWDELEPRAGEPFAFAFEVDVRPTATVEKYKGIEVTPKSTTVAEAEVDEQVERLCQEAALAAPLEEGQGLPEKGLLTANLRFIHEGEEVHKVEGARMDMEHAIPGCDEETFKDRLTGCQAGQKALLPMTFREGFPVERVIGLGGEVEIEIKEAFRVKTPTEAEFVEQNDFESAEELREAIQKSIARSKEMQRDSDLDRQIIEKILVDADCDVPDKLVQDEAEEHLQQMRKQLEGAKLPEEEISAKLAQARAAAEDSARASWRAYFVSEAIAKKEKILVTEREIADELQGIAQRNQKSLQEVRKFYEEKDLLPKLRSDIKSRKVRAFLREHSIEATEVESEDV